MKKLTTTIVLFTLLTLFFVLTNETKAQDLHKTKVAIEKYEINENSVKSLIIGIKSENPGLRNSAIFYAGQYKLEEAVDYLIEELRKEENPGVKILIAFSLYKIGNPIAIEYIRDMVNNETNLKVKHMFSSLYNDFVINNTVSTVSK